MHTFKNAFGYNAAFSALSGIVIAMDAPWIAANLIAAPDWLVVGLGLVLVGFAGLIAVALLRGLPHTLGLFIILQDGLWVLLTTMAIVYFWEAITPLGVAVIMGINLLVAAFALAQKHHLAAHTPASFDDKE